MVLDMKKKARIWFCIISKLFTFISLLLSMILMVVCVALIISTISKDHSRSNSTITTENEMSTENTNIRPPLSSEIIDESTSFISNYKLNDKGDSNYTSTTTTNPTASSTYKPDEDPEKEEESKKTFSLIKKCCFGAAIFAAILQFLSSLKLCLSCSRNVGHGVKIWILVHSFVFILLIACASVLAIFDPEVGEIKDKIENQMRSMTSDASLLNQTFGFYVISGINNFFLCLFILINVCSLKCGQYVKYDELKDQSMTISSPLDRGKASKPRFMKK